jgi:nucleoside-diphosphate-sugar epimerase
VTCVITGARGYIGNALVAALASQGRALRLVSRSATAPNGGGANTKIEQAQCDLRDEESWHTLLEGADAVVHLSSRTDLRAAESDPVDDDDLNVKPVRALVRATRRSGRAIPVIFASTVTIVGPTPSNPVNEQTPDLPCSVYDRHKRACETILREATQSGVVRACSLRLANVYGYGVSSVNANRGILNAIMRRATQNEALTLYGHGENIRDFIFIGDVVDAFCRALASEPACDGSYYVIATGRGHSLADAFNLVALEALRYTGRQIEIRHVPEPPDLSAIERRNFVGDSSLFTQRTGWRPRMDLASGIADYFARLATANQAVSRPDARLTRRPDR